MKKQTGAALDRLQAERDEEPTVRITDNGFRFYFSEASSSFDELVYTPDGKRPVNEDPFTANGVYFHARRKADRWWVLHAKRNA